MGRKSRSHKYILFTSEFPNQPVVKLVCSLHHEPVFLGINQPMLDDTILTAQNAADTNVGGCHFVINTSSTVASEWMALLLFIFHCQHTQCTTVVIEGKTTTSSPFIYLVNILPCIRKIIAP
jgi:hypothetical protein